MGNVPSRSWPSKRQADQFGAPTNAQVGRVQDLVRPHPLNDATSAADILADAVFYIDAQEHAADGGNVKTVRNRGWGGSVLNARCGSTSVPDTNDPRFLAAEPTAYVYLPGVASNFVSIPDETALDITGDIDISVIAALDDWTPALASILLSKRQTDTSWQFYVDTSGTLSFLWSPDNVSLLTATSTAAVNAGDGSTLAVRVTLDVNNGASGNTVTFYTSTNGGASWTQLGNAITNVGTTSIYSGASRVEIGSRGGGTGMATGKFYRAIIKNGIDGTTVLDVDTSALTTGNATSFTATTGQTVTINRSTSGRKTVVVPSADVKKVDDANVYLPGVNGNYMLAAYNSTYNVTDLDVAVRVAFDDWTPATTQTFIARDPGGTNRVWAVTLPSTGSNRPNLTWYPTGASASAISVTCSAAPAVTDGGAIWFRVTLDVDNGAGGYDVKFWTAPDSATYPSAWTQLGTTTTGMSTTNLYSSTTAGIEIGSYASGTNAPAAARYYRAQVLNGINGTTVLDIDCTNVSTNFTPGTAAAFPAVTGQTVTLNSTAGSAMRVNPVRFAQGGGCWLFGTDDYMEVPTTATGSRLLDFGPNDSFTAVVVGRLWNNADNMALVGKKTTVVALTPATGFVLSLSTANSGINRIISQISDGTNVSNSVTSGTAVPGWTAGATTVMGLVANKQTNSLRTSANDTATTSYDGSAVSLRSIGSLTANQVIRIGATPAGSFFAAIELQAVAIFRRALTAAEIATLTTAFQGRYA